MGIIPASPDDGSNDECRRIQCIGGLRGNYIKWKSFQNISVSVDGKNINGALCVFSTSSVEDVYKDSM